MAPDYRGRVVERPREARIRAGRHLSGESLIVKVPDEGATQSPLPLDYLPALLEPFERVPERVVVLGDDEGRFDSRVAR